MSRKPASVTDAHTRFLLSNNGLFFAEAQCCYLNGDMRLKPLLNCCYFYARPRIPIKGGVRWSDNAENLKIQAFFIKRAAPS